MTNCKHFPIAKAGRWMTKHFLLLINDWNFWKPIARASIFARHLSKYNQTRLKRRPFSLSQISISMLPKTWVVVHGAGMGTGYNANVKCD